jgi:N-acetylneuraminic acid mutarotase
VNPQRRAILAGGLWLPAAALAQHHGGLYERLREPGRIALPEVAGQQSVFDSPAPKATSPGRWAARAPLPRGANPVGVEFLDGRLYAIGGLVDQNRRPHNQCFVYEKDRWVSSAPLPNACGSVACVALGAVLHAIGGAVGDTSEAKRSVDWHLAYEPKGDRWAQRAPLPTGRDHVGALALGKLIHVVGGRVNNFYTNSNLHHSYDPAGDRWEMRSPLPTARSGHGTVLYRGKIFVMGGEGANRVFGQNEAYDPQKDAWEQYAPMPTPRHGLGAAVVGDAIYVAGGGPVMGGGVQSAVHEAFTLA